MIMKSDCLMVFVQRPPAPFDPHNPQLPALAGECNFMFRNLEELANYLQVGDVIKNIKFVKKESK